jgi:hypothetical protein
MAMQTAFSRLCQALKWIIFCLVLVAFGGVQAQQSWPGHPLRILVPYPPGGSTDSNADLFRRRSAPPAQADYTSRYTSR